MADTATLVVGAGGLLGSAVVRDLRRRQRRHATVSVPWNDETAALDALSAAAHDLVSNGGAWQILWCAGSGVVASRPERLEAEIATLESFLGRLAEVVDRSGALFLASSAGGVYAGSQGAPFTERTTARAISPYGEAKLRAEASVRAFADRSGTRVLIGRIANLYGPGQDPLKAQGLITMLCRAHLVRRPTSIYVGLDTARDYVYVDDAARMAVVGTDRVSAEEPGAVVVKIIASQTGTTVAAIMGELRRITKHRPRVVLGSSSLAAFQVQDLRFRSEVWPELDSLVTTSLPAGMAATMRSAAAEVAGGTV